MDQETWKFINTFAPWFSAIGTIAAVIVSLYLARINRIKLRIYVGHRILVGAGNSLPYNELIFFSVTNIGIRDVKITGIGWRKHLLGKIRGLQLFEENIYNSELPVILKDGQEAKWQIPIPDKGNWINNFCKDFLLPHYRLNLRLLRLQVFTSLGQVFETKIEKSLKVLLIKECKRIKKDN